MTEYGRPSQVSPPQMPPPPAASPSKREVRHYNVSFTGNAADFFKIWIVNLALTIVTLGFYMPWARVRTQQYFYGHTWLDGHNFEYTANPLTLLRSYLIVGGIFLVYSAASQLQFEGYEFIVILILLIFVAIYPWLVRQSMRFLARNTQYRGIRFGFDGSVGDAYMAYGLANVVSGIGGIIALPWAWFMQRSYQFNNLAYGQAKGRFRGEVGPFYTIGFISFGVALASIVILGIVLSLFAFGAMGLQSLSLGDEASAQSFAALFGMIVILYIAFIFIYNVSWIYARAATLKYVMNNGELGGVVRSGSTIEPFQLLQIGVVNSVAQIISFGLLTPWAMVRTHKYIVENIQIRSLVSLDSFTSAQQSGDESALGEAASDLLNMDVGF